jgi:hypothetical protein
VKVCWHNWQLVSASSPDSGSSDKSVSATWGPMLSQFWCYVSIYVEYPKYQKSNSDIVTACIFLILTVIFSFSLMKFTYIIIQKHYKLRELDWNLRLWVRLCLRDIYGIVRKGQSGLESLADLVSHSVVESEIETVFLDHVAVSPGTPATTKDNTIKLEPRLHTIATYMGIRLKSRRSRFESSQGMIFLFKTWCCVKFELGT